MKIHVLATGAVFLGPGVRSFEQAVLQSMREARREIQILAYLITAGAELFLDAIQDALSRHVTVTLVVNDLDALSGDVRRKLIGMERKFPECFHFYSFRRAAEGDMHAKLVIADRRTVILGSANMTWRGGVVNHEIGVMIEGPPAWELAAMVDHLVVYLKNRMRSFQGLLPGQSSKQQKEPPQ
ncbi:MAG: phospholipase D-like domain-containing protein [candidate division WOR-3 bacterium]